MNTFSQVVPCEIDYTAIAEKTTEDFANFIKERLEDSPYTYREIKAVLVDEFKGYYSIGVKIELSIGIHLHKFNYFYETNGMEHVRFGTSEIAMLQELLASDPS